MKYQTKYLLATKKAVMDYMHRRFWDDEYVNLVNTVPTFEVIASSRQVREVMVRIGDDSRKYLRRSLKELVNRGRLLTGQAGAVVSLESEDALQDTAFGDNTNTLDISIPSHAGYKTPVDVSLMHHAFMASGGPD